MTKKLSLKIEDLEDRIAPGLLLPNDMVIFSGADNPSPNFDFHPNFFRSPTAVEATTGYNGPSSIHNPEANFNHGPWSATDEFGGPLGFVPNN